LGSIFFKKGIPKRGYDYKKVLKETFSNSPTGGEFKKIASFGYIYILKRKVPYREL
tara:strand:+ start:965 stop:1132 length:168 start_codon:yes stop_codon:yes gene_type:complete